MKLSWHNSAFVRAPSRLIAKSGSWEMQDFPIQYGVLDHPTQGLILIDTGYGPSLFESRDLNVALYRNLLRPKLIATGDAHHVILSMGATAMDVSHIFLSHLHADHMCGLERFPNATIHASSASLQGWKTGVDFSSSHKGFFPSLLPEFSSRKVQAVETAPVFKLPWRGEGFDVLGDGSVISVGLPGHMKGHIGFLFPKLDVPVFYAADAEWTFSSLMQNSKLTLPARFIIDDSIKYLESTSVVHKVLSLNYAVTLSHDVMI